MLVRYTDVVGFAGVYSVQAYQMSYLRTANFERNVIEVLQFTLHHITPLRLLGDSQFRWQEGGENVWGNGYSAELKSRS